MLAGVLYFCALIGCLQGSAIPIWEYLSKQEKTSYIYSLFANQVEKFCEGSPIPLCSRQLLKYGLGTLKSMDEDDLDRVDPYQREASNIIWEALMKGHRFEKTTPKPQKEPTKTKPNSYEDESFSDYEDYSPRLDNVYVLPPPEGFVVKVDPVDEAATEKNVSEGSGSVDILKTPDGQGVFDRFQNQYRPVDVTTESVAKSTRTAEGETRRSGRPLRRAVVVRLYREGTSVRGAPQDDDLRQYQLQRVRVSKFV